MKNLILKNLIFMIAAFTLAAAAPFFSPRSAAYAQGGGNTISGQVFGIDRTPVYDVTVELLDDLSRTLARVRTSSSGRYFFPRLSSGRFTVRVMTFGGEYDDQEQQVEITNFARGTGNGESRIAGFTNEQRDFYLKPRKGVTPGSSGAVFAQEVPPEAKRLYESALADLENKKVKEAYAALKSSLEIFPKYFAALELLGSEYVKAGYFEAAQILYSIAVGVNPRAYKSWHGLGYSLYQQQKYPEALAAAQKAIELNGRIPEPAFLSGVLLRHAKKYDEAEKQFARARDLSGDTMPEVHWELALLYGNNMKRYKDAARELRQFLKARPNVKDVENIKKLIVDFDAKSKSE